MGGAGAGPPRRAAPTDGLVGAALRGGPKRYHFLPISKLAWSVPPAGTSKVCLESGELQVGGTTFFSFGPPRGRSSLSPGSLASASIITRWVPTHAPVSPLAA